MHVTAATHICVYTHALYVHMYIIYAIHVYTHIHVCV